MILAGALAEAVVMVCIWRSKSMTRLSSWLLAAWMGLVAPLSFIALGELRAVGGSFALWEGANYLFPSIPIFLAYVANRAAEYPPQREPVEECRMGSTTQTDRQV